MGLIANYHTHTLLCSHAVGMSEDYITWAIDHGFKVIGMSDHAPIPKSTMTPEEHEHNWTYQNMSLDDFYHIYLPDVNNAIQNYGDKIKIYRAVETEFVEKNLDLYKELASSLDYMILGAHYFEKNGKIFNSYADITYENVCDYAESCVKGMETGLFKILAHPDLFMFSYRNEFGKREFDNAAIKASKMIIESAIKNNVYLEINANGLKNSVTFGDGTWLYPCRDFWKIVKTYDNVKTVIGADAHNKEALTCEAVEEVSNMATELGITPDKIIEI